VYGALGALGLVVTFALASPRLAKGQELPSQQVVYDVDVTNVAKSAIPVHEVNDPAHDPFGLRVNTSVSSPATFVVPPHKRLIITNFTGFDNEGSGSTIEGYEIDRTTSGVGCSLRVPVSVHSNELNYACQSVTVEADAGTTVYIYVADSSGADTTKASVDIAGYYVDEAGYYLDNVY
jgi:hypothetical protein